MKSSVQNSRYDVWQRHSRNRRLYGPPLRPSAQDVRTYWQTANQWIRKYGAPRVLLLGVTPEIYGLPWPERTDFLAVDSSQAMIDSVWPGPKNMVQCGDWLSMNLPDGSRDLVFCDGGMQLIEYPQGQQRLIRLLRDIVSDRGLCIFRLYALPSQRESPETALQDLFDGKISDLGTLKIRLSMSLQSKAEKGVLHDHVYRVLVEAAPDLKSLAEKIGWPAEDMLAINDYKGMNYRLYYLTVEQVMDLFCRDPGGFRLHRLNTPPCDLGERFPIIALQRLAREESGAPPFAN